MKHKIELWLVILLIKETYQYSLNKNTDFKFVLNLQLETSKAK